MKKITELIQISETSRIENFPELDSTIAGREEKELTKSPGVIELGYRLAPVGRFTQSSGSPSLSEISSFVSTTSMVSAGNCEGTCCVVYSSIK